MVMDKDWMAELYKGNSYGSGYFQVTFDVVLIIYIQKYGRPVKEVEPIIINFFWLKKSPLKLYV